MTTLKTVALFIKNFMIVFSFIVNLVLVIVVVTLGLLLFDIKNNIAMPLVTGLHSSFVGLDQATIDYTIPVRETIPVNLNIPIQTDTVVSLREPVPLQVTATINLPGVGTLNNAVVNLQLPAGLQLPVSLDMTVPVSEQMPVELDVRAVIPLQETQIHDPVQNLRLLFEPIVRVMENLPDNYEEAGPFISSVLAGNPPDLMAGDAEPDNPWPGYSRTAGLGYSLAGEPIPPIYRPLETGIVPVGGIPALDERIRPELYAEGGPEAVNAREIARLERMGVPPDYYNGNYFEAIFTVERERASQPPADIGIQARENAAGPPAVAAEDVMASAPAPPPPGDMGILPAPGG